jgi:SAM-dependent methyltransferase
MTGSIRRQIVDWVPHGTRVLDVGSGTGALCFDLANQCDQVTGIDISGEMVEYANRLKMKKRMDHLRFRVMDATRALGFEDQSFHYCILTMALHQFPEELRWPIMKEGMRVARYLIMADYYVPLPRTMYGYLAKSIERLAGGEHYRNFLNYYSNQGLRSLIAQRNVAMNQSRIVGGGIFSLIQISNSNKPAGIT